MKLVLIEEGKKEVVIDGTLPDILFYLNENEDLYRWILDEDPEMNMPELEGITTKRDLEAELEKVNLGWWALNVVD